MTEVVSYRSTPLHVVLSLAVGVAIAGIWILLLLLVTELPPLLIVSGVVLLVGWWVVPTTLRRLVVGWTLTGEELELRCATRRYTTAAARVRMIGKPGEGLTSIRCSFDGAPPLTTPTKSARALAEAIAPLNPALEAPRLFRAH